MKVKEWTEKAALMGRLYVYRFGTVLDDLTDEDWADFHHDMWKRIEARKRRFSEREPTAEQVIKLTDIAFGAAKDELKKQKRA